MIKVIYTKEKIIISGHANYESYGNDIVCASVSSIVYTTINAILNFNAKAIKYIDNNNTLEINILNQDKITKTLITNMLDLLNDLEKQYPENIKLSKGE